MYATAFYIYQFCFCCLFMFCACPVMLYILSKFAAHFLQKLFPVDEFQGKKFNAILDSLLNGNAVRFQCFSIYCSSFV